MSIEAHLKSFVEYIKRDRILAFISLVDQFGMDDLIMQIQTCLYLEIKLAFLKQQKKRFKHIKYSPF